LRTFHFSKPYKLQIPSLLPSSPARSLTNKANTKQHWTKHLIKKKMSKPSPILKKPKVEQQNNDDDNEVSLNQECKENNGREEEEDSMEEQKVALIALIEHRSRALQHLKQRVSYYQTQVACFLSCL
jgi:hypothetical protein